ncbi:Thioredoxin domain-containing protein 3-like [Oopsacas minuta]|uniref:Thioredoxin domain-containing protein 3-like n=1 Tax=Oopsacas minuta TaxID=111878 RepID=A0AAV7JRL5_9METZ|nr:Thioredoxin domain-containing protein 3-like [Oopsacas minuta]
MPGKRTAEVYTYINSDGEWDSLISSTHGLLVIEIHAEWCGTCKALHGIFKRFTFEHLGDIHFAAAAAESISYLEAYRGRCQPTFHMYASQVLVGVIHGSRGAQIQEKMLELLQKEKDIASGEGVRIEVVDSESQLYPLDIAEMRENQGLVLELEEKEVTVVVIKPDVVKAGKVEEIMEEINDKGIQVLAREELILTGSFVEELYIHLRDQPQFPDLVAFMTGGPSVCLALTQSSNKDKGIVEEFRNIIGPYDAELARVEAPTSLRAKYGTDAIYNAIHANSTREQAARELAFCFPKLGGDKRGEIQRILALVRLDSLKKDKEEILCQIREARFEIACIREISFGQDKLHELSEQDGSMSSYITKYMIDTPVLALCLCREDAVQGWLEMIEGDKVESVCEEQNTKVFYGSSQEAEVEPDLDLIFPVDQTVAVIKPDAMEHKDQVLKRIEDSGFHIAMQKETELSQDLVSTIYQNKNESDYYDSLEEFMCSGPSLMLVLSKRDAVNNWRNLIGPVDPVEAQEIAPTCLRAIFGKDILENRLHGCSSRERVDDLIKVIFEDNQ